MNRNVISLLCLFYLAGCDNASHETSENLLPQSGVEVTQAPSLTSEAASNLAQLPMNCITVEYPNKLNQVLGSSQDLASPKQLHPAFYGCFDWHSAVHGHWSLVSLLKKFPQLPQGKQARRLLINSLSQENIEREVAYFNSEHNKSFERTYGWSWLLKLALELRTWDDDIASNLSANLSPLTEKIIDLYLQFLPKLVYPIRVGEHTNTAFGLGFALDYANETEHGELKSLIEQRAIDFYADDKACPLSWEPSGFDFLSPCLEVANLMRRVLPADRYFLWLESYLPQLSDKNFDLPVGLVSDRSDGKLVHLDGLNFSRAWNLYAISRFAALHNKGDTYQHLQHLANRHMQYSLPNLVDDSYEGGHWLASFAIEALNIMEQ